MIKPLQVLVSTGITALLISTSLTAQNKISVVPSLNKSIAVESAVDNDGSTIYVKPAASWAKVSDGELSKVLNTVYGLKENAELKKVAEKEESGLKFSKMIQTVSNVEVEGGDIIVHRGNSGEISGIYGTLRNIVDKQTATVSGFTAVSKAITTIGENQDYAWKSGDGDAPTAKLVYAPKNGDYNGEYRLAYKTVLSVTGNNPARWVVFVDAETGEVINKFNSIHTTAATGSGSSLYSGTVSITTDLVSTTYSMKDVAKKIETYNMNNKTNYTTSTIFTDTDNIWNTTAQRAGVDAHYGATKTYDYYKNVHGRNSYDNLGATIKSYVHYSSNYNNAYWDGTRMTYGDGDGTTFTPLVTIDVAGHEITHAVTEKTANLTYQNESGALNEAWSDMFGTAIEFYTYGTGGNWLIGEGCYTPSTSGDALRSMSNPNAEGQPDTYQGTYWYTGTGDNGGVHYNSGVANYWFYLLSVGGSGTNDKGTAFNVTGITISKAEKIAHLAIKSYMTSSTNYAGARTATLSAAAALYGSTSAEYTQVGNAWTAVGVGGGGTPPPPTTTFTEVTETTSSNNTTGTAQSLAATPVAVTGFCTSNTDNDYFKVNINAASTMAFKLVVPSGKDYDLYVYNSAGTQVASSVLGSGQAENITISNSGSASFIYAAVKPYRSNSTTLSYRLEITQAASAKGIAEGSSVESETVAQSFELNGNYPNPFNPSTTISFNAPDAVHATVEIFNSLGQSMGIILNDQVKAGRNDIAWNASHLTSGTYLYRVTLDNQVKTGKMLLMK